LQPAIRNFAALFVGCLLFHIAGSWSLPLIDRDEPRFAEASREMRARGDYVVPFFNNQYRFDKPPLTYWCQVASYRVFGENDFAARFPSAIAAALTAVVLLAWGSRVGGLRVGWWAALMFTLCLQTFVHGKAAVADMWLVFFVTLAHWAGYELWRDSLGKIAPRWWWMFYLSLGGAFLAKGPIGWTPLLALVVVKWQTPSVRLNRRFHFLAGIALMLGLIALWGVPALLRTNGEFFRIGINRHVIGRSVGTMEGHGAKSLGGYLLSLPFYFIAIFASFFPWSIKLPWLAKRLWRERDDSDRYLLACAGIIFIVFSLVRTKLPHYTLPAFPVLALLLAKQLPGSAFAEKFVRNWLVGMSASCLAIALFAFPFASFFFPSARLFREARPLLQPEMEFGAIDYNEPSLVWYFRSQIHGWMKTPLPHGDVKAFLEKPGARFVVLPSKVAADIFSELPAGWKKMSVRGFNIAKFKRVELTLILKPS
jgi:4-amino-4-deoxy-L-arabinose transferase-like glycosyltransferase